MSTERRSSAPLLAGMAVLMLGAGLQGTLLGVRATLEGFSTLVIGAVMASYFVGYIGGSLAAPKLIERVGHIRVFAALASVAYAARVLADATAIASFMPSASSSPWLPRYRSAGGRTGPTGGRC